MNKFIGVFETWCQTSTYKRNTDHTFFFQQWKSKNNTFAPLIPLFFFVNKCNIVLDVGFNYNHEMKDSSEGEEKHG